MMNANIERSIQQVCLACCKAAVIYHYTNLTFMRYNKIAVSSYAIKLIKSKKKKQNKKAIEILQH